MMLARVADSLYWIGRYIERAEHFCRLSDVMLAAAVDRTESAKAPATWRCLPDRLRRAWRNAPARW